MIGQEPVFPYIYRWRDPGKLVRPASLVNYRGSLHVSNPPLFPLLRCRLWGLWNGYGWVSRVMVDGGD